MLLHLKLQTCFVLSGFIRAIRSFHNYASRVLNQNRNISMHVYCVCINVHVCMYVYIGVYVLPLHGRQLKMPPMEMPVMPVIGTASSPCQ